MPYETTGAEIIPLPADTPMTLTRQEPEVVILLRGEWISIEVSRSAVKNWEPDILAKMIAMRLKGAINAEPALREGR